jgi:hypothetical protein
VAGDLVAVVHTGLVAASCDQLRAARWACEEGRPRGAVLLQCRRARRAHGVFPVAAGRCGRRGQ